MRVFLSVSVGLLLSGVVSVTSLHGGFQNKTDGLTETASEIVLTKPFGFRLDIGNFGKAEPETSTSLQDTTLPEDTAAEISSSPGFRLVSKAVRDELRQGRPTAALKLLETDPTAKRLKSSEYDRVKAVIAQSYLVEGKIVRAGLVAEQAALRSGKRAPLAGWVAGQAAWRSGDYAKASSMFGLTAESSVASPWLAAGGAYWAARAAARAGNADEANARYEQAARYPRTFYGLIAMRVLGRSFGFNWTVPDLSRQDKNTLSQDIKISAALRLARQGELSAAITTLSTSPWMKTDEKRRALLGYFRQQKSPALTLFVARKTRDDEGRFYDTALYPESPWEPHAGYRVDKALIHALIRQESRFNPFAVSRTGAQGLMQIMPSTAQYVSANLSQPLSHPETNIEIGQRYVKKLLRDPSVKNDLFLMAVAYNAGPGNLARWKAALKDVDDPMVFIESIPSAETRDFVERVMVNYWIYSLRMGNDVPSLDAVAMIDHPDTGLKTASLAPTGNRTPFPLELAFLSE